MARPPHIIIAEQELIQAACAYALHLRGFEWSIMGTPIEGEPPAPGGLFTTTARDMLEQAALDYAKHLPIDELKRWAFPPTSDLCNDWKGVDHAE